MVRTARKATKVTTAAKNTAASSQKKAQKALEDENADLRRRIEQLQQAQKSEGSFIPKPKGQAGRGDGYNLYEEMRLSSHATYNVIRNVVRVIGSAYLDLRLTWTKQDHKAKCLARKEIKKVVTMMKYYHGAWPIDCFLKQYLGSSAAKYRKDLEKLNTLDEVPSREKTIASGRANADPEDFVSFGSDESSSDEMEVDDEETHEMPDKGKSKVRFEMEMDDDEETEMNSDKKKSKKPSKVKASTTHGINSAGPSNKTATGAKTSLPAGEGKKDANSQTPLSDRTEGEGKDANSQTPLSDKTEGEGKDANSQMPLSDKTQETENRPKTRSGQQKKKPATKAKKRKSDNELEHRPTKQTRAVTAKPQVTPESDWPSTCPDEFCGDLFPSSPSKRLVAAYRAYRSQQTAITTLSVCLQIRTDQKLPDLHQVALKNKWPIDIDFDDVAKRIGNHRDEFSGFFTNEIVISVSAAWKSFIQGLANHRTPLSKFKSLTDQQKFSIIGPISHCGYYGPRGNEAISQMIYSTLLGKDRASVIGNLQIALGDIIKDHRDPTISLANFWDSADGGSVSLTSFIEFVVTPHIANTLIQEDLQTTTDDEANVHRLRSKEIGDVFQYTDGNDDENEDKRTGQLPGRLRKVVQLRGLADSQTPAESSNNSEETRPTVRIPPLPRLRKKNGSTGKAAPKQLTMSDFPPPVVKTS